MRVLTREQFVSYARTQIELATKILARHGPDASGCCLCGQQLPCAVVERIAATRDWYQAKLALLDSSKVPPVLAAAPLVKWLLPTDPSTGGDRGFMPRRVSYREYLVAVAMTLARRHRPVWSWIRWRYVCRCGNELPCRHRHRVPINQRHWPGEDDRR